MMMAVPPESEINAEELVFDVDFYHNKYPDLQNAFHHNNDALRKHWHEYGIKEGRACSEVLDLTYYLQQHPDLQRAFGSDYTRVHHHFFEYGIKEMRASSPTYNPNVYKNVYPFLANFTPLQLMWHFMNIGRKQGMIATMGFTGFAVPPTTVSPEDLVFDPDFYHNKYPDLQNAFHHDNAALKRHWHEYGIKEGRACSEVLDLTYYLQQHPDLQKAFGTDYARVYHHYFEYGIQEMRNSSPTYHPHVYQDRFGLQGFSPLQLLQHYMNFGRTHYMWAY